MRRHRRALRAAQHERDGFAIALEAHQRQFGHVVRERDVAQDELHGVRAERDEVVHLAKNREATRIRTVF